MSESVSLKVERVRDLIAELRADLEPASDRQFLEELCADATGWEMELEEGGSE